MPSFRDLADAIPQLDAKTPVAALPAGISRPMDRDPVYVEPTLTVREGDPQAARAILVAAPAAVGKSMFAKALAADRGALLWNLGEFPVGSGSFLGKLTESHGIGALAGVTEAVSGGEYCVVFDALDEGYSLARSDNFEAFLSDFAKQIRLLEPTRPAVVMCGRTDTIELTSLLLAEAGLDTCVMTLDFFSPEAARDFVDVQLDRWEHAAHRQFRAPFEQARDSLFNRIQAAVSTENAEGGIDAPSFLGYAPVLVALAGYLEVGNYQALAHRLDDGMQPGSEGREGLWAFLRDIVVDLLLREQPILVDKLPAHVRDAIPADRLGQLYSPEEQCARLLARAARSPAPPVDLPASVLPEYEESVAGTLSEHPFVGTGPEGFASVVFRDYVLGRALAEQDDAAVARGLAGSRAFKPSPLLVRFFVECLGDSPTLPIDAGDLSILYSSAHAEEVGDARASLTVEQAENGLSAGIITARGDLIEFIIGPTEDRRMSLGRRLARSDISAPDWTIVFGPGGAEAVIGPDVTISCDRISVIAASLRLEARGADDVVTWKARCIEHDVGEFQLTGADRERFRLVVAEQPAYPWTGFLATDNSATDGHEPALDDAVRELKKLATRFKPGPVSGNAPALPVKIMNVLAARERVSPELYDYAVETGLITIVGKVCLINPQQFGMNIVDIRQRRLTPAVEDYLAGYLRSRQ